MSKKSEEYTAFDAAMRQILTVPKAELDRRVREHKEKAAQNPNKRGPKPKARIPSVGD